jgi:hypothetical protein
MTDAATELARELTRSAIERKDKVTNLPDKAFVEALTVAICQGIAKPTHDHIQRELAQALIPILNSIDELTEEISKLRNQMSFRAASAHACCPHSPSGVMAPARGLFVSRWMQSPAKSSPRVLPFF